MLTTAHETGTTPLWAFSPNADKGVRFLRPQERLIFEGDDADHLYEVLDGVLRIYKMFLDGRRQVTAFAFAGDVIGFSQGESFDFDCDALTAARVRAIPRSGLLRAVRERPEFGEKLLAVAASEATSARNLSITLGRKSAIERVASFLCSLADRQDGAKGTIALAMTRADIADYLGLTIETVSRNITKLRALGLITLQGASAVRVDNMPRLRRIAECEDVVN